MVIYTTIWYMTEELAICIYKLKNYPQILLRNENVQNSYISSNIKIIQSRWMRWTGHVACMGEIRTSIQGLDRTDHLRELTVDCRTI
jgi:hypothetical protein